LFSNIFLGGIITLKEAQFKPYRACNFHSIRSEGLRMRVIWGYPKVFQRVPKSGKLPLKLFLNFSKDFSQVAVKKNACTRSKIRNARGESNNRLFFNWL